MQHFQILIVSAVKICKLLQLLGTSCPDPLPGLRPSIPLGDISPPDTWSIVSPMKIPDPPLLVCFSVTSYTRLNKSVINNLVQGDEMLHNSLDEDVSRVKARVDDGISIFVAAQIRHFFLRV